MVRVPLGGAHKRAPPPPITRDRVYLEQLLVRACNMQRRLPASVGLADLSTLQQGDGRRAPVTVEQRPQNTTSHRNKRNTYLGKQELNDEQLSSPGGCGNPQGVTRTQPGEAPGHSSRLRCGGDSARYEGAPWHLSLTNMERRVTGFIHLAVSIGTMS